MRHMSFHPNEQTLHAPVGTEDRIGSLRVVPVEYPDGTRAIVSCWQLSWKELFQILFTRKVYLGVMGNATPPVRLATDLAEFLKENDSA